MFRLPELPEAPVQPTPYTLYNENERGTNATPFLTHITHGQRASSRIFHSKQEGKYYESSIRNCQLTKFSASITGKGSLGPVKIHFE